MFLCKADKSLTVADAVNVSQSLFLERRLNRFVEGRLVAEFIQRPGQQYLFLSSDLGQRRNEKKKGPSTQQVQEGECQCPCCPLLLSPNTFMTWGVKKETKMRTRMCGRSVCPRSHPPSSNGMSIHSSYQTVPSFISDGGWERWLLYPLPFSERDVKDGLGPKTSEDILCRGPGMPGSGLGESPGW